MLSTSCNSNFKIQFSLTELNEFINTLSQILTSCLYLTEQEQLLFEYASKKEVSDILLLRDRSIAFNFIKSVFKNKRWLKYKIHNYFISLKFHLNLILLLHKLKTLYNIDLNMHEDILQKLLQI